jgi:hypothetical protein
MVVVSDIRVPTGSDTSSRPAAQPGPPARRHPDLMITVDHASEEKTQ